MSSCCHLFGLATVGMKSFLFEARQRPLRNRELVQAGHELLELEGSDHEP